MVNIEITFQRSSTLLLLAIILFCNHLLPLSGSISSQQHNKTRHNIPTAHHQPPSQLRSDRVSVIGTNSQSNKTSQVHKIKLIPKLLPFNSSELYFLRNSSRSNRYFYGDTKGDPGQRRFTSPQPSSFVQAPKTKLQQLSETHESFADRPMSYGNHFYPSWFPTSSESRNFKESKPILREPSHHREKEDLEDCRYDSIELRAQLADIIFTGTIKKQSKGRQHNFRNKRQVPSDRHKFQNQFYNPRFETHDIPGQNGRYFSHKYAFNYTNVYSNQAASGDEFFKNSRQNDVKSNLVGGFDDRRPQDKFKLPLLEVDFPNGSPLAKQVDDRDFYDVAKVEIKRIIKGRELLEKHIFEDSSLSSGTSKYYGNQFVTIYGLNNPSICMGSASLFDTRIFPVKEIDDHLMLSFSMEKMSLNNLQQFDAAVFKAGETSRKHENIQNPKTQAISKDERTAVVQNPATKKNVATAPPFRKTETQQPPNRLQQLAIDIISEPSDQRIEERTSALFTCGAKTVVVGKDGVVRGISPIQIHPEIEWFRNYKEKLSNDPERKVFVRETKESPSVLSSVLRLEGVASERSGMIECRVSLRVWEQIEGGAWVDTGRKIKKSASTLLRVNKGISGSTGFPKINMNPQVDLLTVLLGKPLDLVCNAYARTPPKVKWLTNGLEHVKDELSERIHTTSSGVLHFREVAEEDGKSYECRASNMVGTTSRSITLKVTNDPCELMECKFGSTCQIDKITLEARCYCQHHCHGEGHKPMCSTEEVTFNNMCFLKQAECQEQRIIKIKSEGPCKADDPCENMDCLFGSKCLITFDGSPACECPDECLDHDGGKVCGTDDQTYDSRCQLKRQSCIEQREIFVKFDGPCDPCQEVTCYYGSRCIPTSQHSASCQCTFDCSAPWKNNKVCATDGKTYLNECEMEKVGCLEQRSLEVQFQGACDPCEDFKCSFGAKCMTTKNGKPSCKCMHSCGSGDGMKVCGTDGRTYDSVCHLEKASCVLMVEIGVQLQGACDPCAGVTCGFGSKCILDNNRNPECACLQICKEETYKVCGTDGRSYEGVCELEKRSCEQQKDIQIEFMGPCDPCEDHVCQYGGQCMVDNNNRPICSCEEVCNDITDNGKLCGTDGVTYKNLCDMKRLSCDQQRDIKVNYTGSCDLCEDIVCKFGSKCIADDGHHICKCTETCENKFDPQKVCGFDGVTYPSICELERASCEEQREIKMEYLGSCDPCEDVTCNYGAKCELTPQGHPVCLCSTVCFEELSVERKVCGTNGQTYSSRCAMEKASCEEQREIGVATLGSCDPCEDHVCQYGSQCMVDNNNRPICSCEEVCNDITDNRKLCGTDGMTYKNLCDMKRLSCDQQRDIKVNYTGSCDLCEDMACYFGSKCVVDDDGHHLCKCTETCENEFDPQKVCGFDGVTYPSICELERASCEEQREIKLEFMGPCDPCEEVECKFGSQCLVDDSRMAACYCSKPCNASNTEKLCGSDGMTYENLCELEKTSCNEQRDIHINSVGPCDSCIEVNCHFGSQCQSDENNLPICVCPDDCDQSDEGQPVCGSDGKTYINTCLLELASCQEQRSIAIAFQGRCDPCDGFICSFGSKCSSDENGVPSCHCPQECDRGRGTEVCGDDGRTYADVCELEEVACRERRNVEVKFEGPCDPCLDMECRENEQCQIDLNKIPSCKCPYECESDLILPVCASNGLTYSSECVMEHEACLTGDKLRVITQGECTPANNLCMAGACDSFSKCEVDSSGAPRCFCPFSCELSFKPVCGSDRKTYENQCHLEREACIGGVKIDKLYDGACDVKIDNTCRNFTCGEDEVCVLRFGYKPECQCISCSQEFKPVCGSGMKTFTNECHLRRQRCLEMSNIEIEHVGRCDLCKDVECDFHGVCNSTTGACECICDSKDTVEVCASNGMTYPSECYVNMMSCHSRTELLVVHVGRCDQCLGVNCYYGAECQNGICSCKDNCQSEEGEVCGTDGLTYKSECHLELTSCLRQSDIQVSHVGTCHEKAESKPTIELGGSGGGDNDDDDVSKDIVIEEEDLDKVTSDPKDDEGSGFEGSGRWSTNLKESLVTETVDESSVDSSGNIYEGTDRTRREICTEENCNYGGRCEWNLIGQQFCNCQFKCDAVRSPVCGSDGKTYANECEMKEFSCKIQQEITVQSYEICDDFFEEICDGQTPLSDPKTNRPLDCLVSKRCPKNSYCHVSGHVARCCPEENVCKCHPLGSVNTSCNTISKQCPCKPGVIGKNCDRCNTNFWGIHKIQDETQGCLPCNCNKFGSERSDCEQTSGKCICLEGVTGQKCDKCANGKKLSKDGCVDERNRRSKPCPSEVTCRFGATCQMTPDGPQCVCPDSCTASDRFFADGVVCGTDNKVYASKCQLELMTCRLQTDIKVLSYGPCPESRSQDDSPRKPQPVKPKQSGDEMHHVYPSFSSQSWMKLHKPQFGSNDVTLNFELKAAKTDGVIFYLGTNDYENKEFMALSLRGGIVEFRYDFGQGYSVLKSSEKIRAGGWHKIVASKFGKTVLLTLDNQLPYTKRDTGSLHSLNLINHAYLGFPPGEESRSKVGLATGFQGCIKSLIINSSHHRLDYQLHNYASSKDVEEISQLGNCKRSACAKFPCEHGGQCFDINDGKSFRCKCKEGFSGANCHVETVLFPCQTNPCLNDGTCVATDDGAYACQCPEQFSGHHCHIRRY